MKIQLLLFHPLFGCWVRRLKVTKQLIFPGYCFAAMPARWLFVSKRWHVSPKAVHNVFKYIWRFFHPRVSARKPFWQLVCKPDFINQEEFIQHMEICSGTDPEPDVLKLICPYCYQTFETYDRNKNHIGTHIMRQIRNLQNLSRQFQPGSAT